MRRERPPARAKQLKLRLYIAGHSANSAQALASLTALCTEHFPSAHDLDVIDMLDHPQRALTDGVLVTPTLIRLQPLPVQRIVGSLSDTKQLLRLLAVK